MANTFKVKKILGASGVFSSSVEAPNLVYNTGNQTISGVKTFATRPTVNGTGVLLSGEIAALPNTIVYTTGNQTVSDLKDFTTRPTVNTIPVLLSGEVNTTISGVLYSAQINIKNDNGSTIYKGQPVYVSSAAGTNILVKLASNSGEQTSSKTLGLVYQTSLAQNAQGTIVTEGLLQGFNTNAGEEGDPIWLGPTGSLIFGLANKPYAPNHLVYLGVLTRKHANQGEVFVKIQNGFELEELHNVNINHKNVLNNDDILRYNSASGLWFNETLNTGIFQTQINSLSGYSNSTFATIANLAATGSANFGRINSLSGTLTSTYATIANLASTGSTLDTKINSLSGYVNSASSNIVFTTGNQNISGDKNFIGTINTTGLVVSGLGNSFILKSPNNQNSVFFESTTNGNAGAFFSNYVYSSNMGSRGDDNFTLTYGGGGARSLILFKSVNRVLLDSNGNFGIASGISSVPSRFYVSGNSILQGEVTVSGNTTITGHLSAASKSFLIQHPVDSSKKLQYGSLESPYHGVRLTDKGKINSDFTQIDLPEYISALVLEEGVNVQLTNINHDKILFVKEVNIENNYFKVGMNRGWLDKNEYEFYWSFTAERKDIPKLTVEF